MTGFVQRKSKLSGVGMGAAFALLSCFPSASGAIDQVSRNRPTLRDSTSIVQSFTAGSDAGLVGLWLFVEGAGTRDSDDIWTVTLYRLEGDRLGAPLGGGTFVERDVSEDQADWLFVRFDSPYPQSEGETLAFTLDSDGPFGSVGGYLNLGRFAEFDSYPGGASYSRSGDGVLSKERGTNGPGEVDYLFQTVVDAADGPALPVLPTPILRVRIENGFGVVLGNRIRARNLTTGEVRVFEGGYEASLTGPPGEIWEFQADLDEPLDRLGGKTSREAGYSDTEPMELIMPTDGLVRGISRIRNLNPRRLPKLLIEVLKAPDGRLSISNSPRIEGVDAETRYTLQFSDTLGKWTNLGTSTSADNLQGVYLSSGSSKYFAPPRFFRILIATP